DDVGVRELAAHPRLLDEHVDVILERAVLGLDVLDSDGALKSGGATDDGLVDRGHPPFAGKRDQLVLAVDHLAAEIHDASLQRLSSKRRTRNEAGFTGATKTGGPTRARRARPWRPRAPPSPPPSARSALRAYPRRPGNPITVYYGAPPRRTRPGRRARPT